MGSGIAWRSAWLAGGAVLAAGCGLSLDLDPTPRPPDTSMDASARDAGAPARDAMISLDAGDDAGAAGPDAAPPFPDAGPMCSSVPSSCIAGIAGSPPGPACMAAAMEGSLDFQWDGLSAYEGRPVEIAVMLAAEGALVRLYRTTVSMGTARFTTLRAFPVCAAYVVDAMVDVGGLPEVCDGPDLAMRATVAHDGGSRGYMIASASTDSDPAACQCFPIIGDLDSDGCVDHDDGCILADVVTDPDRSPPDPRADIDGNGLTNNFDIDPFNRRIAAGPVCGDCPFTRCAL